MVVFDEFPGIVAARRRRQGRRRALPGLRRSSPRTATWFPQRPLDLRLDLEGACRRSWTATTPRRASLPTSSEHPNSIFALLGKSHTMNVSEEATTVCPRDLCKDARLDEPFLDRLESMADDSGSSTRTWSRRPASRRTCRRSRRPGATSAATRRSTGEASRRGRGRRRASRPPSRASRRCSPNLQADRNAQVRRLDRRDPQAPAAVAELQARAAAARAVAVPADRPAVQRHGRRPDPRPLAPELSGPDAGRAAPAAPPAPARLRRPRRSSS